MSDRTRLCLIILMTALLRYTVTFHPYSGEKKPPMYGDYEAQRHWQEITFNLPVHEWYINSTHNDLQYWGLDYPPLTAYHSFIIGAIANYTNPNYVKLHESRGYESEEHKLFMRLTVFVADLLVYFPAMFFFFDTDFMGETDKKWMVPHEENIFGYARFHFYLTTALLYPGTILIDHGHFQYNCVSLGFFILSVTNLIRKNFVKGSMWFVLALNYKQMELYHALPIFFYILGHCRLVIKQQKSVLPALKLFLHVSIIVIGIFLRIWEPFFNHSVVFDVIKRLFPISRGVFEDKVSNIWCVINIFIKLRDFFDNYQLAKICFIITIVCVLPSCLNIFYKPFKDKFLLSLINTALGFYLFSFQVHEKSILLAATPVVLYLHKDVLPCFWFLITSVFSMLPLFVKDNLIIAYWGMMMFYIPFVILITEYLSSEFSVSEINNSSSKKSKKIKNSNNLNKTKKSSNFIINYREAKLDFSLDFSYLKYLLKIFSFSVSMTGMVVLTICIIFFNPPDRYPDLFPLLISVYSCGHFLLFFVYFNVKQIFLTKSKSIKLKTL